MSESQTKEYPEISGYGYIKDGKVYLKGYYDFKDRIIGEVRESDEESMRYFVNRYDMAKNKVDEVEKSVQEAENKGSYLMKLIHMRTYLAQFNGLGDFPVLFERINDLEDEIRVYISKNRDKNFEIKTALLNEAKLVCDSSDWKMATAKLKELKLKWIKTGSAHKEVDDQLTEDFNNALEKFFQRRKDHFKEQARILNDRFMRYKSLVSQIRRINREGSDPMHVQRVKNIQREWKNVGRLPKNKFFRLNNDFRKEVDHFFNQVKYKTAMKDKTVVEIKQDLLREVENMVDEKARLNITTVKDLQNKWKNLGKQPDPMDKELNLKFRIACNELFEVHFLDKSVRYLFPDIGAKPFSEQVRLKMNTLRDTIRKDEEELQEFQRKHAFDLASNHRTPNNYQIFQQRNNLVNKIKTKQRILQKLEDKLLSV